MKKSVSLFLCILCCLFPLSACSQPEKSIEDHVNLALEQFGKPLGEAFEGMKLPGSLEEAAKPQYCLLVEDAVNVLGKQSNVALLHLGRHEEGQELTEQKTESVAYSAFLDGDYAYPLKLYQALLKAYGEAEPVTGAQSFGEATEASLEAMKQSERCVGRWEKEDYVIEISFYVGTSASGERLDSISLDIRIPDELLDLPTISPDGEIIG